MYSKLHETADVYINLFKFIQNKLRIGIMTLLHNMKTLQSEVEPEKFAGISVAKNVLILLNTHHFICILNCMKTLMFILIHRDKLVFISCSTKKKKKKKKNGREEYVNTILGNFEMKSRQVRVILRLLLI